MQTLFFLFGVVRSYSIGWMVFTRNQSASFIAYKWFMVMHCETGMNLLKNAFSYCSIISFACLFKVDLF